MENKILKTIDFSTLLADLRFGVFKNHSNIFDTILNDLITLCNDNFICYQLNMSILECRKMDNIDHQGISSYEGLVRRVGESRVNCKAKINKTIHNIYSNPNEAVEPENWMSDDIVYSVGEMLDRISIEFIKQNHFIYNSEDSKKIEASRKWEARVRKYLLLKLEEIEKKQFYEIAEETRTYNIIKFNSI
jgi:hypothetical protein